MERKLRYHEQKLLKKHDFFGWNSEFKIHEATIIRRYQLQRDDYGKYNAICKKIRELIDMIEKMNPEDPFRAKLSQQLSEKLYSAGTISQPTLEDCKSITVSKICGRRLATLLVRLKFCENITLAVTYIKHGHVRVGLQVIKDPAYLVTRSMEDYITWSDTSKIRKTVMAYNDLLDDYDLLC
eukprot:TRINITY_DN3342_c0_g1_i2.p1 TRINITY_DN3342_c0_g1~~TRINITY_DN3342_c0_g1_i2.p1  ORF type:complete len:182 (-),score=17.30 TRINITY_DN3342_c0_g1_i2:16-561(-)